MKIVLAFDSFKGSLSAEAACREAARAIAEVRPAVTRIEKPLADGGEGTAAALLAARGGEWIPCPATGPLPELVVDAGFALLADGETAVVETAAASGLTLLRPDQRNPLAATTRGTGELIAAALRRGARRILLAAGGSATVDGGMGAAHALGWRFLDREQKELAPIGASLPLIADVRALPDGVALEADFTILADVCNPLCGPHGAARVYGPQKGATPAMVDALEKGLAHFAELIEQRFGVEAHTRPGGGAAGGLAAGLSAFLGGCITPGIDFMMDAVALDDALAGADWVLTGEGSFDAQSLEGKVVSGVARRARAQGVRVAVLAGQLALEPLRCRVAGIAYAEAITPPGLPQDEAFRQAPQLLHKAVARFADTCL